MVRDPGLVFTGTLIAIDVIKNVEFRYFSNPKCIHALLHVHVFTPTMPWQFILTSHLVHAIVFHSLTGKDLHRALKMNVVLRITILDVHVGPFGCGVLLQNLAKAVWEEHCIWVYLHYPIVAPETTILDDFVPSMYEGHGVHP